MNPIQSLIKEGHLTKALEDLLAIVPNATRNEVVQLQNRLNELERMNRKGIIGYTEANIEHNKIVEAVLVLSNLPQDAGNDESKKQGKTTATRIYFSYAWGDQHETGESREKIVNDLYESLIEEKFLVLRDKMNIEYGGLISKFMREIGQGDLIVVFMSDKYLRSPYCMWELCEIYRNSLSERGTFASRVLPVRVENLEIGTPKFYRNYFTYWQDSFNDWNETFRDHPQQIGNAQWDEFQKSRTIKDKFGDVIGYFHDMNAKTKTLLAQDNFSEIKQIILTRLEKLDK